MDFRKFLLAESADKTPDKPLFPSDGGPNFSKIIANQRRIKDQTPNHQNLVLGFTDGPEPPIDHRKIRPYLEARVDQIRAGSTDSATRNTDYLIPALDSEQVNQNRMALQSKLKRTVKFPSEFKFNTNKMAHTARDSTYGRKYLQSFHDVEFSNVNIGPQIYSNNKMPISAPTNVVTEDIKETTQQTTKFIQAPAYGPHAQLTPLHDTGDTAFDKVVEQSLMHQGAHVMEKLKYEISLLNPINDETRQTVSPSLRVFNKKNLRFNTSPTIAFKPDKLNKVRPQKMSKQDSLNLVKYISENSQERTDNLQTIARKTKNPEQVYKNKAKNIDMEEVITPFEYHPNRAVSGKRVLTQKNKMAPIHDLETDYQFEDVRVVNYQTPVYTNRVNKINKMEDTDRPDIQFQLPTSMYPMHDVRLKRDPYKNTVSDPRGAAFELLHTVPKHTNINKKVSWGGINVQGVEDFQMLRENNVKLYK
uniref:Uncharacterized protein n=1 Tax=Abalone asfa-like virus TaxID=2839893 RepID=A0A5K7Y3G5_9VIRU|nr:hypothetical protein [Abalone asfa-like virus]